MARISHLTRLFQAVSAGDWGQARVLAKTIADAEDKAGHHGAAAALRGALTSTGPKLDDPPEGTKSIASLFTSQPDVLTLLPPAAQLADVELSKATRQSLNEVLKEHQHRHVLISHGLRPRNRLFFHGPPGCGKTMTARALGNELGLQVYVIRFDTLVGSYLGQTSLRIREVFQFAEAKPCVLLIDEIDAVGRRRGKLTDVTELDRVVISLMQQLDLANPSGVIIAASNIPNELDTALLRRFDLAIEFPAPTPSQIRTYARREAIKRGLTLTNNTQRKLTTAKTFAEAEQVVEMEHRRILLQKV